MKPALLILLLVAACSRSRRAPTCEQTCDRMLELAEAHLEHSITRMADHSDPETAARLWMLSERLTGIEGARPGQVS